MLADGLCHRAKAQVEDKGRQQPENDRAGYTEPHRHLRRTSNAGHATAEEMPGEPRDKFLYPK